MCGIIGYIANRKNGFHMNETKAVKDMLYINALRGDDSTGIFYVNNRGDVQTHKEVGDSANFLKTKEWEASEKELFRNGVAVVGHCRASTRGAKTDLNAHPFIVDNKIVLVHNGTYNGSHSHLAKTDVDSHAIAHVLAENDDIPTALQKINAAYALVWYNTETKHLYAVRNSLRPLWIAIVEDGSLMFASEIGFLYTAAWRNSLKFQKGYPELLDEHKLFSCDLDDITKPYNYEDIDAIYRHPPIKKEEPANAGNKSALTQPKLLPSTTPPGRGGRAWVPTLTEIAAEMGIGKYVPAKPDWWNLASPGTILFVEATDYKEVDELLGHYFVYGKIISSNQELNGMLAGWEITAAHELEVVDYVTDHFYRCTVEYNLSRGATTPGSECTCLWKMKEAVPADSIPVETFNDVEAV